MLRGRIKKKQGRQTNTHDLAEEVSTANRMFVHVCYVPWCNYSDAECRRRKHFCPVLALETYVRE